ncbi:MULTISPECIES: DUF4124 domain-containing protein [Microbulbifer]|uniref:DUF4124 domain-containing protein n=1 Tax=Microbulbifer salipaludis TaxID=187980 RepID=A0ABS3E4Z1_9GAMM|nr:MULTISPECIES: DUF4124 domain-containing protein [Microbulbifer]MBN8430360.1 DUF4124 domain-containing protein [Microbulbifer salipaludis]
MRTTVTTLCFTLSLLATAAQADGIYKWVDENGVVHFGSQPPQQEEVEVVKAPKSERYKKWQEEQQALLAQRKMTTAAKADNNQTAEQTVQPAENTDSGEAEMAAREQRCRSAQQRLQELERHARVREVDASGNYRVLPEEERQQRIKQTKDLLASC